MLLVAPPQALPREAPSSSGVWTRWGRTKQQTPGKMGEGGAFADARGERHSQAVVAWREERRHVGRR
jgi:hypothetical protein